MDQGEVHTVNPRTDIATETGRGVVNELEHTHMMNKTYSHTRFHRKKFTSCSINNTTCFSFVIRSSNFESQLLKRHT